jgi:hypothetical protein
LKLQQYRGFASVLRQLDTRQLYYLQINETKSQNFDENLKTLKRQRGTILHVVVRENPLMNTEHNNLIYPKLHEKIIKNCFSFRNGMKSLLFSMGSGEVYE